MNNHISGILSWCRKRLDESGGLGSDPMTLVVVCLTSRAPKISASHDLFLNDSLFKSFRAWRPPTVVIMHVTHHKRTTLRVFATLFNALGQITDHTSRWFVPKQGGEGRLFGTSQCYCICASCEVEMQAGGSYTCWFRTATVSSLPCFCNPSDY